MTYPSENEVKILENTESMFVCETSGIPAASVRWFKDQQTTNTSDDEEITSFASIKSNTINGVITVTSTLRFAPDIDDNGINIYCTATNSANIEISSETTQLNVLCRYFLK